VNILTEKETTVEGLGVLQGKGRSISRSRLFLMVVAMGAPYFMSNFHRLSLGVLGGVVSEDFNLSAVQLGVLGSALFYTYAFMQLACGLAADRWQTRTLIVSSCLLAGISTLWFSKAETFATLVVSRSLTGLAIAFVYIPALTACRWWFGDKSFGIVAGILGSIGQLGSISASTPLKRLTDVMGWRSTLEFFGYLSLSFAVLAFLCVLKNPSFSSGEKNVPARYGKFFRDPAFLSISAWFMITGGTRVAFQGLWGAAFFTQALAKSSDQSGLFLLWQAVGCLVGSVLLGWISDFLGSIRAMILCGLSLTALWVAFCLSGPGTPAWLIGTFNLLLGLVGAGGITVAYSSVRLFSSGAETGFLSGFNNGAAFLGSAALTQGTGYFMQTLSAHSPTGRYSLLMASFAVACLLSTLGVGWLNRFHFAAEKC
jgi:sugar phosphate permease